jgi:hypothetical protein
LYHAKLKVKYLYVYHTGYTGITPCESVFEVFDPLFPYTAPCRSELAREKPEIAAGIQATNVIVDVHREQARSYRISAKQYLCRSELAREKPESTAGIQATSAIVHIHRRNSARSKLAPTGDFHE